MHSIQNHLHRVAVLYQVAALVCKAVGEHLQETVLKAKAQFTCDRLKPFRKYCAAPDGLCAYHSILGTLRFQQWSQVHRCSAGFALNARTQKWESEQAMALRELAIASTPLDQPVLVQMASEAKQFLTLDICELSWLGCTLNLCIRCSISDEATQTYSNCSLLGRFQ